MHTMRAVRAVRGAREVPLQLAIMIAVAPLWWGLMWVEG
jgi:hypothetical protein